MFTSSVVENAVKANNVQDVNEAKQSKELLTALLISVLIMILLNILVEIIAFEDYLSLIETIRIF